MPIYEYRCPQCGHRTSVLVRSISASAPDSVACSHCGHGQTQRVWSAPALLRGAGPGEAPSHGAESSGSGLPIERWTRSYLTGEQRVMGSWEAENARAAAPLFEEIAKTERERAEGAS
jgi:putative FmdB family regulatory protein